MIDFKQSFLENLDSLLRLKINTLKGIEGYF